MLISTGVDWPWSIFSHNTAVECSLSQHSLAWSDLSSYTGQEWIDLGVFLLTTLELIGLAVFSLPTLELTFTGVD